MNAELFRAIIRRFLPFVLTGAVLAAAAASAFIRPGAQRYQAEAVMIVAPPKNPAGIYTYIEPDRYVESQLGALRSLELAERVASRVPRVSAQEARAAMTFTHAAGSDLVVVRAVTETPALASDLANAYVDLYLAHVAADLEGNRADELADLDSRLDTVRTALRKADELLIVNPDSIEAQTEQRIRSTEYEELTRARAAVEFRDRGTISSQLVDGADVVTEAPRKSFRMVWMASLLFGALSGVGVAYVVRRLSPKSAGASSLEQQFGPAVATIVELSGFPRGLDALLSGQYAAHDDVVHNVAIRVEGSFPLSPTLTVAVVGTTARVGMTSLATSLAASLARPDSPAILVDADDLTERISLDFRAHDGIGLGEELISLDGVALDERLTPTSVPGLSVLGGGAPSYNRANLAELVAVTRNAAHVVVFDCAPVFDSALSLQLCRLCDVVVLGIETRRTRASVMREITVQLADAKVVPLRSLLDVKAPNRSRDGAVRPDSPPEVRAQRNPTGIRRRPPLIEAEARPTDPAKDNSSLIG